MKLDRAKRREALLVGMTKRLFEAGYTVTEISEALNVPEATIRSYQDMIDKCKN